MREREKERERNRERKRERERERKGDIYENVKILQKWLAGENVVLAKYKRLLKRLFIIMRGMTTDPGSSSHSFLYIGLYIVAGGNRNQPTEPLCSELLFSNCWLLMSHWGP